MDWTDLAKIVDPASYKKAVEALTIPPAKEAGEMTRDVLHGLRLFLFPFQLMGALQDRAAVWMDKVRGRVPPERQMAAPPEISGPILENLRYIPDGNPIEVLYLNLLTRAIDKKRIGEAHPAFPRIIEQLSPDEAMMLFVLRDKDIEWLPEAIPEDRVSELGKFGGRDHSFPLGSLAYPEHFRMYLDHLESLNLLAIRHTETVRRMADTDLWKGVTQGPTSFGALFIKACIPEVGFNPELEVLPSATRADQRSKDS